MKIFLALSDGIGYNVINDNFITFLAPIFASIFVMILLCNLLYLYYNLHLCRFQGDFYKNVDFGMLTNFGAHILCRMISKGVEVCVLEQL